MPNRRVSPAAFTSDEVNGKTNNQKKPESRRIPEVDAYYDYLLATQQDGAPDIIYSVLSSTFKTDTLDWLRGYIKKLVGTDLLNNDALLSQPELLEHTLYLLLGPSARFIFEKITNKLAKQFCNIVPSLHYDDHYNEWGDYARMITAIRNNTNASLLYS